MSCRRLLKGALAALTLAMVVMVAPAAQAALWTPGEIDSTTNVLWLDAADTGSITDTAGAVSQWDDKSGNNNHADIVSAGQEPGTGVNLLDGKNVVNFVAASDNEIRTTNLPLGSSLGDFMVFEVAVPKDTGGWHHRWQLGQNGTRAALKGSSEMEFSTYGSHLKVNGATSSGTPFMGGYYASHTDSNAREIWINGANVKSDTNAIFANITTASTGVLLGDFTTGGGTNTDMDMAEFIILKGVRDTDTQEKVEGYLAWKWGLEGSLPVDHTYKSAAPITEGDIVTDLNNDEIVDDADLNLRLSGTWTQPELDALLADFGGVGTPPPGPSTVPEPGSLVLLALGALGLATVIRRRRR